MSVDSAGPAGGSVGDGALDSLGRDFEASLDPIDRHRAGAFFTSPALAAGLLRAAVDGWAPADRPFRVCDPSCGGGVFLLAAGRHLEARFGLSRAEIVSEHLWGIDLLEGAAAVTRATLLSWVHEENPAAVVSPRIVVADTLLEGGGAWPDRVDELDLVIGNPPFQSQLASGTARSTAYAQRVRELLGPVATAYADTASLFLVASLELVRPGGRVVLILPESFLAARDASPAREAVQARGTLAGLWLDGTELFDAAVRVCAPMIDKNDASIDTNGAGPGESPEPPAELRRWIGAEVVAASARPLGVSDPSPSTWAPLTSDLRRLPAVELDVARTLGSMVGATAGFRDQFYGLIPFVSEADEQDDGQVGPGSVPSSGVARLVTSGLIDPAHALWGRRGSRFGGSSWRAPVIDLDRLQQLDPKLWEWGRDRLEPKVLLATQTRVLEAVVDRAGDCWPSVPVVAVHAPVDQLSLVAAVLMAPPVSVWAMRSFAGTALSSDALKLAARQVLEVPLPVDDEAWEAGAAALEQAEGCADRGDGPGWAHFLDDMGVHMCEAYGVGSDVLDWWRGRLPPFRS